MLYTLADARKKVAPFVGTGSSSTTLIDQKVNDALERLLDNRDWDCLKRQVRINVVGNTFALPYNAEKILWCDVDGNPVSVYGQGYQYISNGPGDLDYNTNGGIFKDLIDLGDGWPTQYEPPKLFELADKTQVTTGEFILAAFTSAPGELGKSLKVFGNSANGDECVGGEPIVIQPLTGAEGVWNPAYQYSTFKFSHISRVVKDATTGYVSLYAVYPSSGQMFLLARYHPSQTIPQFRRFRLNNATVGVGGAQSAVANFNSGLGLKPAATSDSEVGTTSVVLAIVRLRVVPLTDPADILPIDSLQALRFAVMAISAEDAKDFTLAKSLWVDASAAMSNRNTANTMTKGTPMVLDTGYRSSLARRMNRRTLL